MGEATANTTEVPNKVPIWPEIVYSPDSEDDNFKVEVNQERVARLLHENEMKDEDIARLRIKIARENTDDTEEGTTIRGDYDDQEHQITLYTQGLLSELDNILSSIEGALSQPKPVGSDYEIILPKLTNLRRHIEQDIDRLPYQQILSREQASNLNSIFITNRIAKYINDPTIPLDRKLAHARDLTRRVFQREIQNTLLHEVAHALDHKGNNKVLMIWARVHEKHAQDVLLIAGSYALISNVLTSPKIESIIIGAVLFTTALEYSHRIVYATDPLEIRAKRFQKKQSEFPIVDSYVKILPKER